MSARRRATDFRPLQGGSTIGVLQHSAGQGIADCHFFLQRTSESTDRFGVPARRQAGRGLAAGSVCTCSVLSTMAAAHASTRLGHRPDAPEQGRASPLRWGQLPHAPARHLASSPGSQQQLRSSRHLSSVCCRADSSNGGTAPTMPHPFSLPVGDTYQSDDVDLSGGLHG